MCTLNFLPKEKVKLEKIFKKQVKRILNLFLYLRISNLKKNINKFIKNILQIRKINYLTKK